MTKPLDIASDVMRLVAQCDVIYDQKVLDELLSVLKRAMPVRDIAVVHHLADEPDSFRLLGVSSGVAVEPTFIARRMPSLRAIRTHLYDERRVYRCEDTSSGTEVERVAAELGIGAYLSAPLFSGDNEPIGALVLLFSTTSELQQADLGLLDTIARLASLAMGRALRQTRERRWASFLAEAGDGMLAWDAEGAITDSNHAAAALTGFEPAELRNLSIKQLLGFVPKVDDSEPPAGRRLMLTRKNGDVVVVAASMNRAHGDPVSTAHAMFRDLSEVVAAEQAAARQSARVRELDARYRALLDNAPLILFQVAPAEGDLVFLNHHAERVLELSRADSLVTMSALRDCHVDAEGVVAFDHAVDEARAGRVAPAYEARLRRADGGTITVRGALYPTFGDGSQVVAIEGIMADVSNEFAARTRLVQTDRLTTLGTLAAGVAHEINNPAAFILLGLDLLAKQLQGQGVSVDDPTREAVDNMLGELRGSIRRIVDIAKDLRLFAGSSRENEPPALVDVVSTVESALTLSSGTILERARVEKELSPVPPVLMDQGRLGQVLVNLLVNAAQAIPRSYRDDHRVHIGVASDEQRVRVTVTDSGAGIPPELLPRIWEPFFSTKGPDAGTGLGLAISRSIVERAGGTLTAESPPEGQDRGTRFVLEIPVAGYRERLTPASAQLPALPRNRTTVLVVEDEPALARALSEQLAQVHDVTVALSAKEALVHLDAGDFGIVLCDLRMPGMSGESLYREVCTRREEMASRFIFMTGVGFGAGVEEFLRGAGRPVLEKPFTVEACLITIAKVLRRRQRQDATE